MSGKKKSTTSMSDEDIRGLTPKSKNLSHEEGDDDKPKKLAVFSDGDISPSKLSPALTASKPPSSSSSAETKKEEENKNVENENDEDEDDAEKKNLRSKSSRKEEDCQGILPNGKRFVVPETVSVMEMITDARIMVAPSTLAWMFFNILGCSTFFLWYYEIVGEWFICLQFIFWRLMYNIGIGLILRWQSNERWFEKITKEHILSVPWRRNMLERAVVLGKHVKKPFAVDDYPLEFSSWMAFRFIAMVILAQDVAGYAVLCLIHTPSWSDLATLNGIIRIIIFAVLGGFAVWSKADAHRVIGDYAWYWGDFFFLLDKSLVFDGIFQMFPHPMYTVGYLFMYGWSFFTLSYNVFYLSVFGHCCQLAFLVLFENPHIDKTYNAFREPSEFEKQRDEILYSSTSGGTGTEQENRVGYFEGKDKELVGILNFNFKRAGDLLLVVMMAYTIFVAIAPFVPAYVSIVQSVVWRLIYSVGVGFVLRKQSKNQWWTKQFKTPKEAFDNFKPIFNAIVVLANLSFIACAVRLFTWTPEQTPETTETTSTSTSSLSFQSLFGQTNQQRTASCVVGALLIGINAYISSGVYEAIGEFGYYYGDFFLDEVPSRLNYDGIYRYMNNPDSSLGFVGAYGVALLSGSFTVAILAAASHILVKCFQYFVEEPHMAQIYGEKEMREFGGFGSHLVKQTKKLRENLLERRKEAEAMMEKIKMQMKGSEDRYNSYVGELKSKRDKKKE